MLFVDSKMLICGCKDTYAVAIGKRQSLKFVLHFPHRTIHTAGRSLFSHFLPKSNSAVLGFLFEDIFKEDKRFLYERVYHEKYNPSSFWKYTAHLLRRTAKKCPQRIKDTPAVLFCLTPRICTVYFQKAYGNDLLKNMRRIYFVVQQKSVLNVSKIRLRYFFCLTSPHICAELWV